MKKVDHRKSNLDKTSYQSLLEIELTEEQRKNLRKQIEEDTKHYKDLGKRTAEDKSNQELYDKIKNKLK
jgi:hypothetical protein